MRGRDVTDSDCIELVLELLLGLSAPTPNASSLQASLPTMHMLTIVRKPICATAGGIEREGQRDARAGLGGCEEFVKWVDGIAG